MHSLVFGLTRRCIARGYHSHIIDHYPPPPPRPWHWSPPLMPPQEETVLALRFDGGSGSYEAEEIEQMQRENELEEIEQMQRENELEEIGEAA